MNYELYPACKRPFCASTARIGGYSCLSIRKCATIQRNQSPVLKAMFGDDFGAPYNTPAWKARS